MPLTEEEQRAQAFRQQQAARAQAEANQFARLAGNPAAYAAFRERWQPVIDAQAERER